MHENTERSMRYSLIGQNIALVLLIATELLTDGQNHTFDTLLIALVAGQAIYWGIRAYDQHT